MGFARHPIYPETAVSIPPTSTEHLFANHQRGRATCDGGVGQSGHACTSPFDSRTHRCQGAYAACLSRLTPRDPSGKPTTSTISMEAIPVSGKTRVAHPTIFLGLGAR